MIGSNNTGVGVNALVSSTGSNNVGLGFNAGHDFGSISLPWNGVDYVGSIPIGTLPPAGPPVTPNNIIYFASAKDGANYTVTSKLYYRSRVMAFGQGFLPIIEHYHGLITTT